jgi:hypothetical protein
VKNESLRHDGARSGELAIYYAPTCSLGTRLYLIIMRENLHLQAKEAAPPKRGYYILWAA